VVVSVERLFRALYPPVSIQDRTDRFFGEGFISELARSEFRADQFGDGHTYVSLGLMGDNDQS
jgi:hypothetical protein